MKIAEVMAVEIIESILGNREGLKEERELQQILKKRLTKKEIKVINGTFSDVEEEHVLRDLNLSKDRFDEIYESAVKKIKNQSVHRDFYEV